jgi:hypothetical protein
VPEQSDGAEQPHWKRVGQVSLQITIASSLMCCDFVFQFREDHLRDIYRYWGKRCQDS